MDVEQQIQAAGLTAPRVTPADIEGAIFSEHYFTAYDGVFGEGYPQSQSGLDVPRSLRLLTFCVLVLKNGFTVTGESACADARNFNEDIGRRIAREHAMEKIWPLLGYELKTRLSA